MHYVYILHSDKDNGLYIGQTDNLKRRLGEHKTGSVVSTKNRLPVTLIFYEAFLIKDDAIAREEYLKSGYGRAQLKNVLKNIFAKFDIK